MKKLTRRQMISVTAATVALGPLVALSSRTSHAYSSSRVDPNDPQAKALSYVHESPKPGQICGNCQLYTGSAAVDWGPCAIFPGKQVNSAGWCSAWVKKAG